MSLNFTVRYKIDISVNEERQILRGAKTTSVVPIGLTTEFNGTKEEIRERISHEIDGLMYRLADIYYGEE